MKKLYVTTSNDEEDIVFLQNICLHLSVLRTRVSIQYKQNFLAGKEMEVESQKQIKECDMHMPLLSIDFVNHDGCMDELNYSIKENKAIAPLIIREFEWSDIDEIKKIEQLLWPQGGNSVESQILNLQNDDLVFKKMVQHIKQQLLNDSTPIEKTKDSSKSFYWILSGFIFILGFVAVSYIHIQLSTWYLTLLSALIFVCTILIVARPVLFPTTISNYLK